MRKFRGLTISSKANTRGQLRQLLDSTDRFESLNSVSSFTDASAVAAVDIVYDYYFIGDGLDLKDTQTFVAATKRRVDELGQKPTFVCIFEDGAQDHLTVADKMMSGFHGFLCPPFTLDALGEVLTLSSGVSQKNTVTRMKAATGLMLKDLRDEDEPEDAESEEKADLWEEVQASCKWYNFVTAESLTQAIKKRILGAETPSDRIASLQGLRERAQSVNERVRQYLETKWRVFRPRKPHS